MTRFFATICVLVFFAANSASAQTVKVIADEAKQRVDVEIGGKLFTSYRRDERIKRPDLLAPGKNIKFRYRLLILAEKAAPETLAKEYRNYIK